MTEPTAELTARVAAYIRGGAYPEVAAQAAGVPPGRLRRWLALGRKKDAGEAVRAFCQAVRQAEAVARLQAEVAALKAKPLDWLRHGPGRPRPDREGWTAAARAEPKAETPEPERPLMWKALSKAATAGRFGGSHGWPAKAHASLKATIAPLTPENG